MGREIVFTFKGDVSDFKSALAGAVGSSEDLSGKITAAGTTFLAASKAFGLAADAISKAFGAVSTVAESTVGRFAEFEKLNLSIRSKLGATAEEMEGVSKALVKIGIETEFTLPQIQAAADKLAGLGATKDELIPLLRAVTSVASVTGEDLATAATIAKGQMNAFELSMADLPRLQAILIQGNVMSAATLTDLGRGLAKSGGLAKVMGQNLESIVPALALLRDRNQEAGTAGRALRAVLSSLIAPSKGAADALAQMGLRNANTGQLADAANPQISDFITVLQTLRDAGLDAGKANAIAGRDFGSLLLQLTGVAGQGEDTIEKMRGLREELVDSGAAMAKVATKQQGLGYELEQIEATFEAAQLVVGKFIAETLQLGPTFTTIREQLGGLLTELDKLSTAEVADITAKAFAPDQLAALFETAVRGIVPAFGEVASAAFFLGARQLVTFAPLFAASFGKAMLALVGKGLIEVARIAGTAMVEIISSGLVLGIEALVGVLAPVVELIPVYGKDAAASLKGAATNFQTSILNASKAQQKDIESGADVLGDAFSKVLEKIELDPKKLMGAGKDLAGNLFGDVTGTLADLIGAAGGLKDELVKAGEEVKKRITDSQKAEADSAAASEAAARDAITTERKLALDRAQEAVKGIQAEIKAREDKLARMEGARKASEGNLAGRVEAGGQFARALRTARGAAESLATAKPGSAFAEGMASRQKTGLHEASSALLRSQAFLGEGNERIRKELQKFSIDASNTPEELAKISDLMASLLEVAERETMRAEQALTQARASAVSPDTLALTTEIARLNEALAPALAALAARQGEAGAPVVIGVQNNFGAKARDAQVGPRPPSNTGSQTNASGGAN